MGIPVFFWTLAAAAVAAASAVPADSSLGRGVVLAALVVGVPHGALDHLLAPRSETQFRGKGGQFRFHALYVGAAASVALGWWIAPAISLSLFLVVSAWHFGTSDLADEPGLAKSRAVTLSRGVLIVATPLLVDFELSAQLLSEHGVGNLALAPAWANEAGIALALAPLALHLASLSTWSRRNPQHRGVAMRQIQHAGVLAGLLLAGGPLFGFAAYFVGWHVRAHFKHSMLVGAGRSLGQLLRRAAPRTAAALALGAVFFALERAGDGRWTTSHALLVLISALTVPHAWVVQRVFSNLPVRTSCPNVGWSSAAPR